MTKQEALERVLLERNASRVEYITTDEIDAHKEYCDVLASALEESINRDKEEKENRRFMTCILIASIILYVLKFLVRKQIEKEDLYD